MPHIPLHTQSRSATLTRLSPYPILISLSDTQHSNFVQNTITGRAARGLASVEVVFESRSHPDALVFPNEERKRRIREVEDAVEWEKEARRRRQLA